MKAHASNDQVVQQQARRMKFLLSSLTIAVPVFAACYATATQLKEQKQHGASNISTSDEFLRVVVASSSDLHISIDTTSRLVDNSVTQKHVATEEMVPTPTTETCSIYWAPSSLLGDSSGYGLYTVRDIAAGQDFLKAPDGPSIPVIDSLYGAKQDVEMRSRWTGIFDDYWWGRGVADQTTFEAEQVQDFQITFGALCNHHCILSAVDNKWPEGHYDDTMADRFTSPGAGAFSYHRGRRFVAERNIEAGEELFLHYGGCERPEANGNNDDEDHYREFMDSMAVTADYDDAAALILQAWISRVKSKGIQQVRREMQQQILEPSQEPLHFGSSIANKYVAALLPKIVSELYQIVEYEHAFGNKRNLLFQRVKHNLARQKSVKQRSVDWIRETGYCMENLLPKRSTLAHAGQGAFAQFPLIKGEIIVPVPLLHVPDKDVLNIHDEIGPTGKVQLLLNYCFGHNKSSLLLCPTTNAILINHCSTRKKQCGELGPNAEYRWADWDANTKTWLQLTVDEIAARKGRGLTMEIVATRDIQPGEEVFIDYGEDWEREWDRHLTKWRPASAETNYISVLTLNNRKEIAPQFISGDLREMADYPYPVFVGCLYWEDNDDESLDKELLEGIDWEALGNDEILDLFGDDGSKFVGNYESHYDLAYWPCAILSQDEHQNYTVRILPSEYHEPDHYEAWFDSDLPRILYNYPRESIHFFLEPYTSDQHLIDAFRSPIGLRDELMPLQWKNR